VPASELLSVNAVTALDLAVLLGSARLNLAVANARSLDRQDEAEGELGPVAGLDLSNRKRHGAPDLGQEVQARECVQSPIEAQHSELGAVIQGGFVPATFTTFTSIWTDSPGLAFSNSFIRG
jgi:hypothetical protein